MIVLSPGQPFPYTIKEICPPVDETHVRGLKMPNTTGKSKDGQVIDLSEVRQAKIEEKKRKYERVIFKQILGSYCVIEGKGLKAVDIVDVSPEGLSFQISASSKHTDDISVGDTVSFRFYFSQDSYLPVACKVQNKRDCIESGVHLVRYGCQIDRTLQSYDTYALFVAFLTKYAATSKQDSGDMHIFFT